MALWIYRKHMIGCWGVEGWGRLILHEDRGVCEGGALGFKIRFYCCFFTFKKNLVNIYNKKRSFRPSG